MNEWRVESRRRRRRRWRVFRRNAEPSTREYTHNTFIHKNISGYNFEANLIYIKIVKY